MKYKTFRSIVVVCAMGMFAAFVAWFTLRDAPEPPVPIATTTPPVHAVPAPPAAPATSAPPTAAPAAQGAAHERFLLSRLGQKATGDKLKDAVPGAVKVNVYDEGGVWGRAKVDLDRDEKWDEKWTLKGGTIEKQVAPADDEQYAERFAWDGSAWVKKD